MAAPTSTTSSVSADVACSPTKDDHSHDNGDSVCGCCTDGGCKSYPVPVASPELTKKITQLVLEGVSYHATLYSVYPLPQPPGTPAPKPGEPRLAGLKIEPITINYYLYDDVTKNPFGCFVWSLEDENKKQIQKWRKQENYNAILMDHITRGTPFPLHRMTHFLLGFQSECFINNPKKDQIDQDAALTLQSTICDTRLDIEFESPEARDHFIELFLEVANLCDLEKRGVEIGLEY